MEVTVRYRVHCPTCNKTIESSIVSMQRCPWTHVHPCTCVPVSTPETPSLESQVIWGGLYLALGGDPALVGGAVDVSHLMRK